MAIVKKQLPSRESILQVLIEMARKIKNQIPLKLDRFFA